MTIPLIRCLGLRAARELLAFVCAVGCLAAPSLAVAQTSGTWTSASGGTWNNTANWSGGAVASGTGAAANFSTLNITGTQTVALDTAYTLGSLSFGDTTTSSTGSWLISNGGTIGNTLTLNAGSGTTPTITVSGMGGGSATISARVSGTQGLSVNAAGDATAGLLILSGSNNYTGNTTVNSGTLHFSTLASWTSLTGTFTVSNAALLVSTTTSSGSPWSRPVVASGTGIVLGQTGGGGRIDFNSVISGTGGVSLAPGSMSLGGLNTYSGPTTIGSGVVLLLSTTGATGSPGLPISGAFGSGTVALAGGSLRTFSATPNVVINNVVNVTADSSFAQTGNPASSIIFTGPMTLVGGTRTFTTDNGTGNTIEFNGSIGDGGNGYGLVKAGNRTLVLGGSNSYSGLTTLNSGTLRLGNQDALRNSTFAMSGTGSLLFSSTVAANAFTFGGLTSSSTAATLTLSNTAGTAITLTIGGNNASTSYAGSLAGGGSVVKVGTGMLSLSGSNSYAGTMTVTGGVLSASSSNALPGWGTPGRVSVGADGTLAVGNDMTLQQAIDAGYLAATSGIGFDTAAGNRTVSDAIAGSRPFVKTGANTLTLTGENTYSASTTVSGGTLQIGDGGTTGSIADNVTLSNSSAIAFNRSDSLTYSASVTGTGSFTKLGAGTLTLSGSNGYTGAATVAGGVLDLGSANALPAAGNITFTGGTLRYSAANTTDFAARIVSSTAAIGIDTAGQSVTFAGNLVAGNTGGLTKQGAGTLTLSGSNTFTGPITVSTGTLSLNGANAVPSSANSFALDGGALVRSSTTVPTTLSNAFQLGAGGGELRNGTTGAWTVSGAITGTAGTGALVLNSSGAELVIGNASTSYTGGTRILSGNGVAVQTDVALGSGTISFEGGTIRTTSAGARILANAVSFVGDATFNTGQRDLTFTGPGTIVGATRTITVSSTTSLATYAGSIGDGGNTLGFTKAGVGTLILGGSNTYSGTTTLSAGTLRLNNADAFAGGGNLSFTGGKLQYSGSNTADYASRIVGSSGAIAIDTNGQSVSFASALAASNSGGLTKSGSGTLTLAANNIYTGTTSVSAGTLQIGNGGTTGSIAGNVTLSNTAALVFNRSNDLTYAGSISGTGSLTKSGVGSLTLSGTNTLANGSAITINGGALVTTSANSLNSGVVGFAFTIDGGMLANSGAGSGISNKLASLSIGSGGATIRSDARFDSTAVFSGTSATASLTYGTTSGTVSNVIVVIGGNNTYAGGTKLESGVSLYVDNNSAFGTGTLDLAGGAIQARAGTSPPRSLANAVTISANTQFNASASNPNLTFTGATTLSGGTQTLQVDNVLTSGSSAGQPGVIFTNVIGDGGNGFGITKTGIGVLALGGANTYSGATTLNTGTIRLQNQNALQNSTLSLSGTGGVVFDSVVVGNAFTLGGFDSANSAATLALQNSATTAIALTVGGNNESTAYAGALTGAGSLEKVGTGSLILSGVNTFAGTATITSGTLQVGNGTTGSLAGDVINNASLVFGRSNSASYSGGISGSGSVTNSGAGTFTLSGSNSYSGPTTLAGGTLALGSASALPASGTVTFTGGALQYSASYTADPSARIAGSTGAIVINTNGQSRTWASSLDSSNVGGLTKSGSGTLTLSAANAFAGPVTLGGGVLALGNADALPSSGDVSFTSGTLQYSSTYTGDLSARIVGSSAAIAIDTNGQSRTWASGLANTNVGGLTKSGSGTLTLSASNAYSGATNVMSSGVLLVNHAAALGSSTSITVNGGSPGGSLTIGSGITTGAGKAVTINSNGVNNDGGLNVISGTGTWAGDVVMNGGRLGYTNGNLVVTGSVGGSSFTVSGYGGDTNTSVTGYAVTLAGPTGYSGATSIIRGWLKIGADNTLPAGTTLDVFTIPNTSGAAQAATFDLNGFNQTVAALTSSGNNGKTGYANGYVTNTGGSVKTLTVNQTTTGTYGGLITGNLGFTKTGSGDLTLMPIFVTGVGNAFVSGTNTFTGDTLVSAGTLTLSTATSNTSLALAGSTFDTAGAGSLSFGSMTAATFGGLKGSGTLALQNGSSQAVALTVGANGGSNTFSGGLTGAGSLIKAGAGTLTLSGSSTNAGATTVSAGSLVVDGSLASAVSLAGSTSLGGRGSVGAISGSGLVGPGNSPGILTATSVDPSGGLGFAFEFTQANPDYATAAASGNDVLSLSSLSPFTSSLASTNVVSIYLTPAVAELGTFTGGFFTSSLQSDFLSSISSATYQYFVQDAGGSFSYNGLSYKSLAQYDSSKSVTVSTVAANGGQVMQMVVVPEPATLALAGMGAALAGWHFVRRRRRSA